MHTPGALLYHIGKVLASLLLRLHGPTLVRRGRLLEPSKLTWLLLLHLRLLRLQLHSSVPRLLLLRLHQLLLGLLHLHLLRLWGSGWAPGGP